MSLVGFALTVLASADLQASDQETAFQEALAGVHAQMERRRWGKARQQLDDLLLAQRRCGSMNGSQWRGCQCG